MPSKHKASNLKQKNKPFKGSTRNSRKAKEQQKMLKKSKGIKKQDAPVSTQTQLNPKKSVQTKQAQSNTNKKTNSKKSNFQEKLIESIQLSTILQPNLKEQFTKLAKYIVPPKIVLLTPFNECANVQTIKNQLLALVKQHQKSDQVAVQQEEMVENVSLLHDFGHEIVNIQGINIPGVQGDNFIFICCPRDPTLFLEYAKISDIVCAILSCKLTQTNQINIDPFENAKAFDEVGYSMLTTLRLQGMLPAVGVLQDLEIHSSGQQHKIKKLFQRFFESEFSENEKFIAIGNNENQYIQLLRAVQNIHENQVSWREKRGYLLAQKLQVNPQTQSIEVSGYVKGSAFSANGLIHITGYGDYSIDKIEVLKASGYKSMFTSKNQRNGDIEMGDNTFDVLAKAPFGTLIATQVADITLKDNLDNLYQKGVDLEGNKFVERNQNQNQNQNQILLEDEMESEIPSGKPVDQNMEAEEGVPDDQGSDISFNEDQSFLLDLYKMNEEKKKIKFSVPEREEDDLEFADEIDYPPDVLLKEQLKEYKGLKSFRATEWDQYDDLPEEYEKIFIFQDINKTIKNALIHAKQDAFAFEGFYVKIYISGFPISDLQNHNPLRPFIISTLFKHEQKLSVLHLRVNRQAESQELIKSKDPLEFHMGFRIVNTTPIFSKIFSGCSKLKLEQKWMHNQAYMASFYGNVLYPPCSVLAFKSKEIAPGVIVKELVGSGEVTKSDPLKVILQRIILTGYPFKLHKRKAVCRMMFYNQYDIKYFMPIEIWTKKGLRGHIIDSIGTHGYMKCSFNNPVKQNDTICMNLYKRVFPIWPYGNSS